MEEVEEEEVVEEVVEELEEVGSEEEEEELEVVGSEEEEEEEWKAFKVFQRSTWYGRRSLVRQVTTCSYSSSVHFCGGEGEERGGEGRGGKGENVFVYI